jgi:glycosyltransferase involved in cell wall biosynthesis
LKIIYYTHTLFQDSDIPYISVQKNNIDDFYVFVDSLKTDGVRSIIELKDAPSYPCICKATRLNSYRRLLQYINPEKTFLLNRVRGRWWHPFSFIVAFLFFIKIILIRPDIIHVVDFVEGYYKFLYLFKKKLVFTIHDPIPHSSFVKNSDYIKQRNNFFSHSNNFIILNDLQREEFVDTYKLQNKNVFVNAMGVYTFMEMFSDDTVVPAFPYILFWGQIQEHKGIDMLLEAMLEVHEKFPNTHLVIAGRGKISLSIEDFAKIDFIHFYNEYLPMDKIASLIRSSLFVVCPYKDATQSGVVMTTFALTKPIIATNVGVLGEVIVDNETGLLIEPNRTDQLIYAIEKLLENHNLLEVFSDNISKNFLLYGENSWSKISEKYGEIYNHIIQNNEKK